MSLEQDIANVVSAAEQLTGIVDTKIEDINTTVNNKVAEVNTTISREIARVDESLANTRVFGRKSMSIADYFVTEVGPTNIHIKLPYRVDRDHAMYHLTVEGYAYGAAHDNENEPRIIDATFVGYCYTNSQTHLNVQCLGSHEPASYIGKDNHIYLRLSFKNKYFLTLNVNALKVGNGTLLKQGDVEIIDNPEALL
ncbi:hypothetical protein [Pseudoalteromonas umbrosa]|uniref:hypothetical protein n=1 Tax=Pseudoalteromonas umbrosa TaxID=3048489 RepID=UPI0024C38677|nr:hypothetical protein [Pseudoalteromonas sp. B95]MDK1287391.1 hypothetical protein [Pseudoalteromonas sp. B95]